MKLKKIRIQNFKSLLDVTVDDLATVNTFVGRNNSGKSAILLCLKSLGTLSRFANIEPPFTIHTSDWVWKRDPDREISVELWFDPTASERSTTIGRIRGGIIEQLPSDFLRELYYTFVLKTIVSIPLPARLIAMAQRFLFCADRRMISTLRQPTWRA